MSCSHLRDIIAHKVGLFPSENDTKLFIEMFPKTVHMTALLSSLQYPANLCGPVANVLVPCSAPLPQMDYPILSEEDYSCLWCL